LRSEKSTHAPLTSFYLTPADWPRANALIRRQTLSEPGELVCPPKARVRPIRCGLARRQFRWCVSESAYRLVRLEERNLCVWSFCLHNNGGAIMDALSKSSAAGPKPGNAPSTNYSRVENVVLQQVRKLLEVFRLTVKKLNSSSLLKSSPGTIWRYGTKDGKFFGCPIRSLPTQESPCRQNSKN
jgi:hypothetical protein